MTVPFRKLGSAPDGISAAEPAEDKFDVAKVQE